MINGHSSLREFGKCRLDVEKKLLWADREPVQLPPKAIDLLCLLVENSGTVVTKDEIWKSVWNDAFVEESNLTHHIYVLRKAFKDLGLDELIKTIPRRGYRFAGEVREIPTEEIILERHALTKTTIEIEQPNSIAGTSSDTDIMPATKVQARTRTLVLAAAAIVGVVIVGAAWRFGINAASTKPPIRSLAVLPFRLVSTNGRDEHFGLSIADSLITRLGSVRSLTVRPTSAIAQFEDDTNANSIDLGKKLQVDAVIEGTVLDSNGRLRSTMRLLRVSDGQMIWSGEFDNASSDEIAFIRSIGAKAVDALNLNATELASVDKAFSTNEDAYQLYLKGRYEWSKRSWEGMTNSERYFRSAIEKDPNFALAYVGLADRLAMTSDPSEALTNVEHALQLDPDLAEAHASAGFINTFHKWRWKEAESELRRAVELAPNYGTAHQWLGNLLEVEGRYDEAVVEMQRAVEIDPTSPNFLADLGQTYYFKHDFDSARSYCRQSLAIDPDFKFAHDYLFNIALVTKDHEAAIEEWRWLNEADSNYPNMSEQQLIDTRTHFDESAVKYKSISREAFIRDMIDNQHKVPQIGYHNARLLALLGDRETALEELQKGLESRSFGAIFVKADPMFDSIRDDPRFEEMLKRINL